MTTKMDAEACYHPSMSRLLIFSIFALSVVGADWPQWRGADRDGISKETGLLAAWTAAGPAVVWKTGGLGEGYSSLAIAGGRIFTQGQRGKQEFVIAFDVQTGKKIWETPTSSAGYRNDRGDGPRGTPTVDGDRLYAMTGEGVLVCLEIATGKTVWWKNVASEYGGSVPGWGFSESPLVDGDRLIVMPGGRGASIVSLHKRDGKLEWKAGSDHAGYSSAILANVGGVKTVLALTAESAIGVQEDNGELLWRYTKVSNRTANIATPIYSDGAVFVSTNYGTGCALLKLGPRTMSEVYFSGDMKNHYSSSVLVDGYLYGYNDSILTAMQFTTGKVAWKNRSVGKGSVTYADKKLYLLGEEGWIGLAEATPEGYREISRFNASKGSLPAWSPLVISDGRLYYRDQDGLTAYDIRSK
jgi:outer membrane protein assembly factor BamB